MAGGVGGKEGKVGVRGWLEGRLMGLFSALMLALWDGWGCVRRLAG